MPRHVPRHRANILTLALLLGLAAFAGAGAAAGAPQESSQADATRISLEDFKTLLAGKEPVVVIDVRTEITEKIKGAVHIPVGEIEARVKEIPRGRQIVTYCA